MSSCPIDSSELDEDDEEYCQYLQVDSEGSFVPRHAAISRSWSSRRIPRSITLWRNRHYTTQV